MNRHLSFAFLLFSALLAAIIVFASCNKPSGGSSGLGPKVLSIRAISATTPPGKSAVLVLSGARIPVEIEGRTSGRFLTLNLLAHGEVVEIERYSSDQNTFSLFEAVGERYVPQIDLIRTPMSIGESWKWNGELESGNVSHRAEATISTSQEQLNVVGMSDEALKVRVDLLIDSGEARPAARTLTFWFVPGKGMLMREFGQSSTRAPVSEASGPQGQ